MRRIALALALALASTAFPAAAQHIIGTVINGGVVQLVDLNPTTGAAALLAGTVTDSTTLYPGTSYDAAGNRYFFLGKAGAGPDSLYVVNIGPGTFNAHPLSGVTQPNIKDIEYNAADGVLYAFVSTSGTFQLASIDTATGTVTLLGSTLGAGLTYSGDSRIDPTTSVAFPAGRFYFRGDPNVYGINVSTRTIYRQAAQPALPLVGFQAGGGGLYQLQLNGSDGRLLSLDTTDTAAFGTATPGANLTGGTLSVTGNQTFDVGGNRYYFIGQASTINGNALSLFTLNPATLTLVASPALSGQTGLSNLEFDAGTVPVTLQRFEAD